MRSASLDRRVRKEATLLVREARTAVSLKKGLRGKGGDLETVTSGMEKALREQDLAAVRRQLPVLDALVDELVKRPPKSTTRDYIESIGTAILIALALRAFVIEAFKIPSSSMYPTLEIGDHIFVNKFIYGMRIPWTNVKFFELRGPRRGEVIVFRYPCNMDRDYIKRVVALAGDTVEVRCNIVYVNGEPVPSKMLESGKDCRYKDNGGEDGGAWETQSCSRYQEAVGDLSYETFHDAERPIRDAHIAAGNPPPDGDGHDFPRRSRPYMAPSCAASSDPADRGKVEQVDEVKGKLVETKPEAVADACEPQLHYVVPEDHVFVMGDNRSNSNDSRFWGSVPLDNIKGRALFIWLSYEHWGPFDWGGIRWSRIGEFVHD